MVEGRIGGAQEVQMLALVQEEEGERLDKGFRYFLIFILTFSYGHSQEIDMSEPLPKRAGRRGGAHFGWAFGGGRGGGGRGGRTDIIKVV